MRKPIASAPNRAEFTSLLREHDQQMRGLAFRMMGSQAAMDDVLQDAYVKAYRAFGSFRGDAQFSTWLYSIVYRSCIDAIRKRNRRRESGLHLVAEQPSSAPPAEQRLADITALEAALASLSPDQRAVLLLVDAQGLSYDEAARILDINPGTVASRLNRARSAARSALHNQDNES